MRLRGGGGAAPVHLGRLSPEGAAQGLERASNQRHSAQSARPLHCSVVRDAIIPVPFSICASYHKACGGALGYHCRLHSYLSDLV
jgi:hypothetical protein